MEESVKPQKKEKQSHSNALYKRVCDLVCTVEGFDLGQKHTFLSSDFKVKQFFSLHPSLIEESLKFSEMEKYILLALIAIEQFDNIFCVQEEAASSEYSQIKDTLESLCEVEAFYKEIGGFLGYYKKALSLLFEDSGNDLDYEISPPEGVDLTKSDLEVKKQTVFGIKQLCNLAEVYPVGGSADRLQLRDEKTYENLPAARLEFLGRTLLEGMIRDLEAREYLYYKLYGKELKTPIALMTSKDKNNQENIISILEENGWFGRGKDSFKIFTQPLVPVITRSGDFCLGDDGKLLMKPGGHGVLWKLAKEEGVFSWLNKKGKSAAIIRQINNPLAGIDFGLQALTGIGMSGKKAIGFASCLRRVNSAEGVNVLIRRKHLLGVETTLSNIEYCDFEKAGVKDAPRKEGDSYSLFPSNTNILFVDLKQIETALETNPFPGMLLNFRKMSLLSSKNEKIEAEGARLELLMQNIADSFSLLTKDSSNVAELEKLKTFITFNHRYKTISTTKKRFVPNAGLIETALGCYYDYQRCVFDLLQNHCMFSVPPVLEEEEFLNSGPSFVFHYHPALGPNFSIIGEKLSKGWLEKGSELQLEIADVKISNLTVEGSLVITADSVTGHKEKGVHVYSDRTGRCRLNNVTVINKGIDYENNPVFWKNQIPRKESLSIQLHGNSEFEANDVIFQGDYHVVVPDGYKMVASQIGKEVQLRMEKVTSFEPCCYEIDKDDNVRVK